MIEAIVPRPKTIDPALTNITSQPISLSTAVADFPYVNRFRQIATEMADLYAKKNADYGNSFAKSVDEFGLVAGLVRLSDKWNRVCELIKKNDNPKVANESLKDTAIDGACYFVMLAMEIERLSSGVSAGTIEFGQMSDQLLKYRLTQSDPQITLNNPVVPYDNNDSITRSPQITC